ncbi:Acyltransferase [Neisseria elongata subsp. glycolytica ATCC 29315]|uniref:Acyltransferase n=1 Tax=Neisseria elongata subsp. glycolytica ATCC 29315 TaxID=546263 RepID=D4DS71_NEIEG|nr:Acyltransferase [Neisseria elongata subsp. glycolytica ATCC 29315]
MIGRLNLVSHSFCILLIVHFCMKDYSTPFLTRFSRLFKMLLWLFSTVRRIRRLDKASVEQRNAEFSAICAEALSILNVRLIASNRPSESLKGVLVVANHISLLDIFAITALCPSSFIAMKELSRWPVIGRVARNADTVFIDRSNRKDINIINEAICRSLTEGKNVCFSLKRVLPAVTASCRSKPLCSNPQLMPVPKYSLWLCDISTAKNGGPRSLHSVKLIYSFHCGALSPCKK